MFFENPSNYFAYRNEWICFLFFQFSMRHKIKLQCTSIERCSYAKRNKFSLLKLEYSVRGCCSHRHTSEHSPSNKYCSLILFSLFVSIIFHALKIEDEILTMRCMCVRRCYGGVHCLPSQQWQKQNIKM